jgi:hypothetical protein
MRNCSTLWSSISKLAFLRQPNIRCDTQSRVHRFVTDAHADANSVSVSFCSVINCLPQQSSLAPALVDMVATTRSEAGAVHLTWKCRIL